MNVHLHKSQRIVRNTLLFCAFYSGVGLFFIGVALSERDVVIGLFGALFIVGPLYGIGRALVLRRDIQRWQKEVETW